jgi:hypothetical protein
MSMKTNEIGDWLRRQHAGKRDHREAILDDDVLVIRPGPHFEWFMKSLAADQATPTPPETSEEKNRAHPHE